MGSVSANASSSAFAAASDKPMMRRPKFANTSPSRRRNSPRMPGDAASHRRSGGRLRPLWPLPWRNPSEHMLPAPVVALASDFQSFCRSCRHHLAQITDSPARSLACGLTLAVGTLVDTMPSIWTAHRIAQRQDRPKQMAPLCRRRRAVWPAVRSSSAPLCRVVMSSPVSAAFAALPASN